MESDVPLGSQFPIIHDYWRRQADSNLESIVNFLKREDVRERGLPALMNIADQLQRLPYQVQQAHLALKRQLLVFMGHCGLYLLVIIPVAWKLLHLLNKQMDALVSGSEGAKTSLRMGLISNYCTSDEARKTTSEWEPGWTSLRSKVKVLQLLWV